MASGIDRRIASSRSMGKGLAGRSDRVNNPFWDLPGAIVHPPPPIAREIPPMTRSKRDLPEKICPACGRPFAWRKKWERDWDRVKFCSDACRKAGKRRGGSPGG